MNCRKCLHHVKTADQPFIFCNGLCTGVYHAACVGLNNESLAAVSPPNKNSFWLCDDCLSKFVQWREGEKDSTDRVGSVLHRDVEVLKSKVDAIMSILGPSSTCCQSDSAIRHSTPHSTPQLESGRTNQHSETPFAPDVSRQSPDEANSADESFALLLTNIDGSVSEEDVQQMVSRCLGACDDDCKEVRKLVPRWVDCNNLDYVSFKVVLNKKWKLTALTPSVWPKHVKFREFMRRQCTWKPGIK